MDKFIDWHPADIVAGLRKRGTSLAAESRRTKFFNAGERPDPPLAERRIDYRHGAGNAAVGHLAVTLPRPGDS